MPIEISNDSVKRKYVYVLFRKHLSQNHYEPVILHDSWKCNSFIINVRLLRFAFHYLFRNVSSNINMKSTTVFFIRSLYLYVILVKNIYIYIYIYIYIHTHTHTYVFLHVSYYFTIGNFLLAYRFALCCSSIFFSKIIHRRIPAFCHFFLRFPRILFLLARWM